MEHQSSSTVYLIDASIYIFRAYFGIPDEWFSPKGYSVNAVYGYAQFILKFIQQSRPKYLAVAYDESLGSCFRNDIYPGYKASRALPDDELAYQLNACKELTQLLGISSPASMRYEADDIIATLAVAAQSEDHGLSIVTRDKDLGQLLSDRRDHLWDYAADKRLYRHDIHEHFAVNPEQMVDYLALLGDSIDDIPGVPGIGKKTAAALLEQFGSVDNLYANLDVVAESALRGAKGIASKLEQFFEQVTMAQSLVRLETNVPLGSSEQLLWQPPEKQVFIDFLHDLGLDNRLQRQIDNCYWWQ